MTEQPSKESNQELNISDNSSLENAQIGGIAGRDLNVNQIQGKFVYVTVNDRFHAPDGLSQQSVRKTKSLTRQECKQRKVLLNKVKNDWVKGVLENALHTKALIELGLEKRLDLVQRSFSEIEEFPEEFGIPLPKATKTIDVFNQMGEGRTLLILGEPGAGKTIALLKLAESLIARTEDNLTMPIPVVFNLSSWTSKMQTISEWLVQELFDKYKVSKPLGKAWVEEQQLLFLLDGLDEVKVEHRNTCVKALNQFIQTHGVTEMVICSRIQDYEILSERLTLQGAICIQPLTSKQIDQYLAKAGQQLEALKILLKDSTEIQDLAKSPLILSLMSLAYKGFSKEELLLSNIGEGRYQHLLNAYIKRMLQRRRNIEQYPEEQTNRWIIWLAQQMIQESQTIFLIENIQPNWLSTKRQKILYASILTLVSMIIYGCYSIIFKPFDITLFISMALVGFIIGILSNWSLLSRRVNFLSQNALRTNHDKFLYGFVIGLSLSPLFIVITILLLGSIHGVIIGCIFSLIYALYKGIVMSLVAPSSHNMKTENAIFINYFTEIIEPVTALVWSWQRVKKAMPMLLLSVTFCFYMKLHFLKIMIISLIMIMRIGVNPGKHIGNKKYPNQGIISSIENSFVLSALSTLSYIVIFLILVEGVDFNLSVDIYFFVPIFIFLGLLHYYGGAVLKHFILRAILYFDASIPWNYARFLDYATERIFLQKVGGGYIFVHRVLMEHFAKMELEHRQH